MQAPYDLDRFLTAQSPVVECMLRSCMTLFGLAGPQHPEFRQALELFYGGEPDPVTVRLLAQ